MSWKARILLTLLLTGPVCLLQMSAQPAANPGPESVVVVANKASSGSLRVAKAYMSSRNIPEDHLILIETVDTERVSRDAYIKTIHNPVLQALMERKLVNAFETDPDAFGRKVVTVFSTSIQYVVLCYGVPSHIENKSLTELDDLALREAFFKGTQQSLVNRFSEGEMARNEASVDTELALMLRRDIPMNGFIMNPFFRNSQPDGVRDILKVTRLDGPSPEAVIRLLDNTMEGERTGLKGRAYVDEDGRGGNYQMGNDWLSNTARLFEALGFDLDHDTARSTFPSDSRFDAPVLYAGWYAWNLNGPFTLPGFRFPPGAVAAHLHSFSAAQIRSETKGWVGPLIQRGVSATFGNVAEPYLRFTHQFDVFFVALAEGWNLADAAYMALPVLSWQGVAIGDPLYRPFKVSLEEQLEKVGDPLNILSDQYVVLRRLQQLLKADQSEAGLKAASIGMRETPGPALALERAYLLEAAGQPETALKAIAFLSDLPPSDSTEWGLFAELADTLHRLGDARSALKIYQSLEKQKMPEKVLLAFLKRGIKVAEDAGQAGVAINWRVKTAPPPPPPPKESSSPASQPEKAGS